MHHQLLNNHALKNLLDLLFVKEDRLELLS